MQSLLQSSSSPSSVNLLIITNQQIPMTEKTSISSSTSAQIRLGLRCLCPFDDQPCQLFDQIFSNNHSTTNISECLFNQYISPLPIHSIETFILLSGQACEILQLQHTLISLTLTHLHRFASELILRITIQELSSETTRGKPIVLPSACPNQTSAYLHRLCSSHQSHPLLITFHLINRLSNDHRVQLHLLSCNENTDQTTNEERFSNLLMSLSLSLPSTRQKQSFHLSNYEQSLVSLLNEYRIHFDEHFLYILATINNEKQLKFWTKIQRLLNTRRNRCKMSAIENKEEIWVDGPLSKTEIWIDGPRSTKIRLQKSTPKHRSKPMHTKAKLPLHYSPSNLDDSTFDTESIVSSHCHLPVLPVFKDHSLLPFRANQPTLPRPKPPITPEPAKVNLKLSTNKLNDDLEMLEKTLETLLVPSPIVPNNVEMTKSLNRMEQLSALMSSDEKNKRLSRIVSPTRFDKILSPPERFPPSVPSSPFLVPKNRHSRTPNRVVQSTKKPKVPVRTTSLAESAPRPSILQRLFGLRSSINSPPLSPLTVTLDSHDDLMPLTTSSTASSGRASSSGYESMSNTALEETMGSNGKNSIRIRNRSTRKDDRTMNSPIIQHQQRLAQLEHRQNELKIELAMTRTFLLLDKNKTFDLNDSINPTVSNSPKHTIVPNTSQEEEEDELEKDIEYLERRLTSAKSQLLFTNYQKNKPLKS